MTSPQKQSSPAALTKANLVDLFQNKSYKGFSPYLDEINDQNRKIQNCVIAALKEVIDLNKTSSNMILGAIVFYKKLLLEAVMDFYDDDSVFPKQIHEFFFNICQYNSKQTLNKRGINYFVDILKEEKEQHTFKSGNTVVILANQIVKNMAIWYPQNYQNGEKSRFLKAYQMLSSKGCIFPAKNEFVLMKKTDQKLFKEKYDIFLKELEEIQSSQHKPSPKPSPKMETTKLSVPKQISKEPQPIPLKPILKQEDKKPIVKSQLEKDLPKLSNMLESKSSTFQKQKQESSQLQKQSQKNSTQLEKHINENANNSNKMESQQNNSKHLTSKESVKKTPQTKPKIEPKKAETDSEKQKVVKEIQVPKMKDRQIEEIKQNFQSKFKRPNTPKQKITQKKRTPEKHIEKEKQQKKQQIAKQYLEAPLLELDYKPKAMKKQEKVKNMAQNNIIIERNPLLQKEEIPQKINSTQMSRVHKMQRHSQKKTPKHISQQKNQYFIKLPKKQSLPKTQKRPYLKSFTVNELKITFDQFRPNFNFNNTMIARQQQFGKTLSSFRMQKRKVLHQTGQKFNIQGTALMESIEKLCLDRAVIPFIPEYFHPLTLEMHLLRQSSQILAGMGPSPLPFFNNKTIEVRLIKSTGSFLLTIKNMSNQKLRIQPVNQSNARFSNRIKILTWGNSKHKSEYMLHPGYYFDVKFSFSTYDFNFKFLLFLLSINEEIVPLNLPITLLDVCHHKERVSYSQLDRYALKGKIACSQPFKISEMGVPPFLKNGITDNYETYRSKNMSKLAGQCSLKMDKIDQHEPANQIQVILKLIDFHKGTFQLDLLYDSKIEDNEDFAKVMMELILFLLHE